MRNMQLRELVTILFLALSTLSGIAQSALQEAVVANKRPSKENIRIPITDTQGNEGFGPISIIKGMTEGPVFTIVSGVHGFEYPPIMAAKDIIQNIDPDELAGTLIIVPIANTASFFSRTPFINPQDNINLNRAFPGDASGFITERIAHLITTEIIPLSAIFLDVHGGDASEDLLPFVCFYNNEQKPDQTLRARALSEASGFEYMVTYNYTLKDEDAAEYAFKQAVQDGKIALSIESGSLGTVQKEAVDLIKTGIYNMLGEMNMYKSDYTTSKKPIKLDGQDYVRAETKGVFHSALKAGDSVKKGDVLGYITDEFGDLVTEINVPHSGIILYKIGTPPVNIGETIACIGYRKKENE